MALLHSMQARAHKSATETLAKLCVFSSRLWQESVLTALASDQRVAANRNVEGEEKAADTKCDSVKGTPLRISGHLTGYLRSPVSVVWPGVHTLAVPPVIGRQQHGYSTFAAQEDSGRPESPPPALPRDPLARYDAMVASGALQFDPQQRQVAAQLSELAAQLALHQKEMDTFQEKLDSWLAERQARCEKLIEKEREELEKRRARNRNAPKRENFIAAWFRQRRRDRELGVGRAVARLNREKALDAQMEAKPVPPKAPEGVYLYGAVGCGKTLLMDMLFAATDGVVKSRRRIHFHAAMLEVNSRMHQLERQRETRQFEKRLAAAAAKERGESEEDTWQDEHDDDYKNIVDLVADEYMGVKDEAGLLLLCFDEVQVTDPFTAIVLGGLLERLLARGAVVVATSNKAPRALNQYGMQGELFDKFVRRLEDNCHVLGVGTGVDYRRVLARAAGDLVGRHEANYLWPINPASQARLETQWRQLIAAVPPQSRAEGGTFVPVMFGRSLYVPQSYGDFARFTFPELCSQSVGAADYIALCQRYHTVVITDVPQMSMRIRDQARRFITLVDELYNHRCRLICTAAAPPDELFLGQEEGSLMDPELLDMESLQFETEAEGSRLRRDVMAAAGLTPLGGGAAGKRMLDAQLSGREEQFAFKRAVSRLLEMQTPGYLQSRSSSTNSSGTVKGDMQLSQEALALDLSDFTR